MFKVKSTTEYHNIYTAAMFCYYYCNEFKVHKEHIRTVCTHSSRLLFFFLPHRLLMLCVHENHRPFSSYIVFGDLSFPLICSPKLFG